MRMGERIKYPDPNRGRRRVLIALSILIIIALTALLWKLSASERVVTFPYFVEGDKLEISAPVQCAGNDPDSGDTSSGNAASITVTNRSGKHLLRAKLKLRVQDGETMTFELSDIPANETVQAFSEEHLTCTEETVITSLRSSARFEADPSMLEDKLLTETDGVSIILTNLTEEDLSDITVYYRSYKDGQSLGGQAESYTIESLPAGELFVFDAETSGENDVHVVRITENG